MGYLTNFIVYTLAMAGVMALALLIFKNATTANVRGKAKHMKVLDALALTPRKTLYIVSAGTEKFLIAGDTDSTTLISKLDTSEEKVSTPVCSETVLKNDYMDKSVIGIQKNTSYNSVMKSLAEKMKVEDSGWNRNSITEILEGTKYE